MRLVIFLICFLAPLIEANPDDGDDPAAINEQLFGKGTFCFFAIAKSNDPSIMHDCFSSNATNYGMGYIDKYRLTFSWNAEAKANGITIEPDAKEKVYGTAYLVPVCQYEDIKTTLDVDMYKNIKFGHSVIQTVQVQKDGKPVTLSCNVFLAVAKPPPNGELLPPEQRLTKEEVNDIVAAFQIAQLPPDYIDKFSKTPTKPC